jgi:hypothetical protein
MATKYRQSIRNTDKQQEIINLLNKHSPINLKLLRGKEKHEEQVRAKLTFISNKSVDMDIMHCNNWFMKLIKRRDIHIHSYWCERRPDLEENKLGTGIDDKLVYQTYVNTYTNIYLTIGIDENGALINNTRSLIAAWHSEGIVDEIYYFQLEEPKTPKKTSKLHYDEVKAGIKKIFDDTNIAHGEFATSAKIDLQKGQNELIIALRQIKKDRAYLKKHSRRADWKRACKELNVEI